MGDSERGLQRRAQDLFWKAWGLIRGGWGKVPLAGGSAGWGTSLAGRAKSKLRPQSLRLSIPHSRARREGVGGGAASVKMETPSGGELPPGAVGVGRGKRDAERLARWA